MLLSLSRKIQSTELGRTYTINTLGNIQREIRLLPQSSAISIASITSSLKCSACLYIVFALLFLIKETT